MGEYIRRVLGPSCRRPVSIFLPDFIWPFCVSVTGRRRASRPEMARNNNAALESLLLCRPIRDNAALSRVMQFFRLLSRPAPAVRPRPRCSRWRRSFRSAPGCGPSRGKARRLGSNHVLRIGQADASGRAACRGSNANPNIGLTPDQGGVLIHAPGSNQRGRTILRRSHGSFDAASAIRRRAPQPTDPAAGCGRLWLARKWHDETQPFERADDRYRNGWQTA